MDKDQIKSKGLNYLALLLATGKLATRVAPIVSLTLISPTMAEEVDSQKSLIKEQPPALHTTEEGTLIATSKENIENNLLLKQIQSVENYPEEDFDFNLLTNNKGELIAQKRCIDDDESNDEPNDLYDPEICLTGEDFDTDEEIDEVEAIIEQGGY